MNKNLSPIDGKPTNWTFEEYGDVLDLVQKAVDRIEGSDRNMTDERQEALDALVFKITTELFREVRPSAPDDF